MNVIICICSKYPNNLLYDCVKNIYEKQIHVDIHQYEVHIVDSDSENTVNYEKVSNDFPDVKIHMIKNKNYEYGAWKYIMDTYPSFDIYFCIQDSIHMHQFIDLTVVNDKTAYTFHHHSGYSHDIFVKNEGIGNLEKSKLNYQPIIDTDFNIAQHCSFIVNKKIGNDIFEHLPIPPVCKEGSRFYERNFGIYFIDKSIHTIDLYDFMGKQHGERN